MEWGTPVYWGWFLLFSRSGGHKTKETYPTRPGSPTPCTQGLNLLRQNIVFSYSERIPVSFSWLFNFIIFRFFFLWLFYVLINFYEKNFIIIIILLYFFFMKIIFIFSCSRMFRNVPGCSMFHVPGFIDARELCGFEQ